ncbi:MAG: hypothetical protein PHE89_03895 [Alphaproteobacteria bacterium]|nr:hypothetical protein [Alphaproteobacteria bacterium]
MKINEVVIAETPKQQHLELLFKHLDLILNNKEIIINTPEFYNVQIRGIGICAMYMGSTNIYLGDLLKLWNETEWLYADDNKKYYTYFIGGSPLTGNNKRKGWDIINKQFVEFSGKNFINLAFPAWNLIKTGKIGYPKQMAVGISQKRNKSILSIISLIRKLKQILD